MAALLHLADNTRRLLATHTLVGRAPTCGVRTQHESVSREHALLRWDQGRWLLRDLGSRNGSKVGDALLPRGEERVLRLGDRLQFGDAGADVWELVEAGAPTVFATNLGSDLQIEARGNLLLLPGTSGEEEAIYLSVDGIWVLELPDALRPVSDGEILNLGDLWRLHLPQDSASTAGSRPASLDAALLRLRGDQTLEHVVLQVELPGRILDLGERKHWFVLWVLGMERIRELDRPAHDQGWVDKDRLAKLTGIPEASLDTYISRARQDLAREGIENAGRVVEARALQRRLGVAGDRVVLER